MEQVTNNKLSRYLTYILRHHPDELELTLDEEAYVPVDQLLAALLKHKGWVVSFDQLFEVVAINDKRRLQFSFGNIMVRAVQGHSVPVTLKFRRISTQLEELPEFLYHGTLERNMNSIVTSGISKMGRHHVHLSKDIDTAWVVARRHRTNLNKCVIEIDARKLYSSGFDIYISENGVYLVDHVMPEFIKCLYTECLLPQPVGKLPIKGYINKGGEFVYHENKEHKNV
jgi:putative RNA 2'-phosphotransferase